MPEEVKKCELETMPGWELKYFLRWVARATEEYFKDPEVQRRYNEFLEEKKRKAAEAEAAAAGGT